MNHHTSRCWRPRPSCRGPGGRTWSVVQLGPTASLRDSFCGTVRENLPATYVRCWLWSEAFFRFCSSIACLKMWLTNHEPARFSEAKPNGLLFESDSPYSPTWCNEDNSCLPLNARMLLDSCPCHRAPTAYSPKKSLPAR